MLKNTIITVLCFYTFCACHTNNNNAANDNTINASDSSFEKQFNHKLALHILVKEIADYGVADAEAIGLHGVESDQYRRYLKLKKMATNEELVDFIKNNSGGVVKAYCFMGLKERQYLQLQNILEEHLIDTLSFKYQSGCLGGTDRINTFFLETASPFLSQKTIKEYRKKMRSYTSDSVWKTVNVMDYYNERKQ